MTKGAQPTERVMKLLASVGAVEKPVYNNPEKAKPKKKAQERAAAEAAKAPRRSGVNEPADAALLAFAARKAASARPGGDREAIAVGPTASTRRNAFPGLEPDVLAIGLEGSVAVQERVTPVGKDDRVRL